MKAGNGRPAAEYTFAQLHSNSWTLSPLLYACFCRWLTFCATQVLTPQPNELHVDPYLLINRGIAASCGHPHLLIEAVADGVRQVDAGVSVTSEDSPVQRAQREEN